MADLETERLKKLKAERAALDARIRQEQQKLSKEERRKDTQRMILKGRAISKWAERSNENATTLYRELEAFCTRNIDRELFNFPPLPEAPKRKKQERQEPKNDERPSVH